MAAFYRLFVVALMLGLLVDRAVAQVHYAPPETQFGTSYRYDYGGDDPLVHEIARSREHVGTFGRVNGFEFVTPRRIVQPRPPRIFLDGFGTADMSRFGATRNDVINQRRASLPTYFRKSDLLKSAIPQPDGSLVVPPTAPRPTFRSAFAPGTILIRPWRGQPSDTALPPVMQDSSHALPPPAVAPKRGVILIIPKKNLDRPIHDPVPSQGV